jgi:hypothetical protein
VRRKSLSEPPDTSRRPEGVSPPTYSVGYGKPPAHTRFTSGKSGNPKGRPKRIRNLRTVVEDTLNERITIREGERSRTVTKRDALVLTLLNGALKSDARSVTAFVILLRSLGLVTDQAEPDAKTPLTADDAALLSDFLQRHAENDTGQSIQRTQSDPQRK